MFRKSLFIILVFFMSGDLYAQLSIQLNGKLYNFGRDESVQGDPFLYKGFKTGNVLFKNGNLFENLRLKFDAEQSRFLFFRKDTLYEFIDDVAEVILFEEMHLNDSAYAMIFKSITGTDKIKSGSFVQMLTEGKITLVKQLTKKPEGENITEGYSSTVRQYILRTTLWVITNNNVIPAKLSSKLLEQLTGDKRSQMDKYIKENRLNLKTEKGFVSALGYYNLIWKK